MRLFSAFFTFLMGLSPAFSQEFSSAVYECSFSNSLISNSHLRMKDYFDTQLGQRAGQVDLIENATTVESTQTLVFQIPLWDAQILVQIWQAPGLRVDGQLSLSGNNKSFPAVYHKGALQQDLLCTTLDN